jgi:hypothetical protein
MRSRSRTGKGYHSGGMPRETSRSRGRDRDGRRPPYGFFVAGFLAAAAAGFTSTAVAVIR